MYIAPSPIDLLNKFREKEVKFDAYVHSIRSQLSGAEPDPTAARIEGTKPAVPIPKFSFVEQIGLELFSVETSWSA